MRRDQRSKDQSPAPGLLAAIVLLGGCTLAQLHEDAEEFYRATVLVGQVNAPAGWRGPVVVAATTRTKGRVVAAHQVWLHEPGGFELIVPDGEYALVAYGDANGNGALDEGEPATMRASPVAVAGQGLVTLLDLQLEHDAAAAVRPALPQQPFVSRHSTQAGALADLDAEDFSAERGREGYWAPLASFRRTGGNIYFVEPFDPARIPVLFVHGAAGSAQDWRYFIDRLDRDRYQAWIFQYPSGASLDSMAHLLYWKLLNLQTRLTFPRVHVVAHSMGGLVVRRFLVNHGAAITHIGRFITLSTPWSGENSATLGVQYSPAVVPSWRDMQPEGDFMRSLFAGPLPDGLQHSLLFSHRGGYSLFSPNTDGTVTLASQLRQEAQAQAHLVMGFDEDHTSILQSPAVFEQVSRLLDADENAQLASELKVSLTFEGLQRPSGSALPALILTPVSTPHGKAMIFPLPATRSDLQLRVAPGRYVAQFVAPGFAATPARQEIAIEADAAATVGFHLSPQGTLSGYVAQQGDAIAQPAGSYRPPHSRVKIQRIVLRGAELGQRVLIPRSGGDADVLQAYLEGRDDAVGPFFSFVALPAGDYELTVIAEGYEPHISRHRVVPGAGSPDTQILLGGDGAGL